MIAGNRFGAVEALDLAEKVGAMVVSVDFRLAPENPAPAQVQDCFDGLEWLAENTETLGVDPTG